MNDEYLTTNQCLSSNDQTEKMTARFLKLRHLDFLHYSCFVIHRNLNAPKKPISLS
jgi:hypothetical protein